MRPIWPVTLLNEIGQYEEINKYQFLDKWKNVIKYIGLFQSYKLQCMLFNSTEWPHTWKKNRHVLWKMFCFMIHEGLH